MSARLGNIKRTRLFIGVMTAIACLPVFAQNAAQGDIEEVVVTGSYIRGSALDAPSPVTTVDRSSIEAQGAAQVWGVIKNLEINSGSFTNEGADERDALSGTANVNLRNLLVLI